MQNKEKYWHWASSSALLFVFLGYVVKFYDDWLFFDAPLQNIIRGKLPNGATQFFKWITQFGNPVPLIILTLAVAVLFYSQKKRVAALYLLVNIALGSGVLNNLLKLVYLRQRPTLPHLVTELTYSFPSGHAMGSMMFFGTLIVLVPLLATTKKWQWAGRIFLGLIIVLIGISRIYLGVHFPSDILGGWLLGVTWLFATYPLYDRYSFIERFKQTQRQRK